MNKDILNNLFILIFCGGGGTRLWPYSREKRPKQFLKIGGNKSLIRQAFERIKSLVPVDRVFIVTVPEYRDEVKEELPEIPQSQVLVEPLRKDTAMAASLGVAAIIRRNPEAIVANIWSDHLIKDNSSYRTSLLAGAEAAASGDYLVTTGVRPKYPHTGLGYVKKGRAFQTFNDVDVYKVEKFTEKPAIDEAKRLVISGNYLWHLGLYVWKANTFIDAIKKYSSLRDRLRSISEAMGTRNEKTVLLREYKKAEKISIDYALAEKAKNFLVVEGKYDWIDIGDYNALWQVAEKDKDGNAVISEDEAENTLIDTKESIVITRGEKITGVIGLSDMIVVSDEDAVLVAPKSQAQRVKELVQILKETKKLRHL